MQSTDVSEVHKLYVNQSMDLHTSVIVSVDYNVSIFAINEGMGILGSTQCVIFAVQDAFEMFPPSNSGMHE